MFGIEKQLDRIAEVLALHALDNSYPHAKECSIEALEKKAKIKRRLNELAFPLEIDL
jgi:hypothetical protein